MEQKPHVLPSIGSGAVQTKARHADNEMRLHWIFITFIILHIVHGKISRIIRVEVNVVIYLFIFTQVLMKDGLAMRENVKLM